MDGELLVILACRVHYR
nr:hypothetical protein [Vulcanococcus limneticus]